MATDRLTLTAVPAWQALDAHAGRMRDLHLRSRFANDRRRGERLVAEAAREEGFALAMERFVLRAQTA
jgi:hypothetical protein